MIVAHQQFGVADGGFQGGDLLCIERQPPAGGLPLYQSVVHLRSGVEQALAEAEQCLLPCGRFVQVHRSYIVSTEKVECFSRREIRLIGGSPVPMGRQYAEEACKMQESL